MDNKDIYNALVAIMRNEDVNLLQAQRILHDQIEDAVTLIRKDYEEGKLR